MSGINVDPTSRAWYEQQRTSVQTDQSTAQTNANTLRDTLNNSGWVDKEGKPLKFESLKDWQNALNSGQLYRPGTPPVQLKAPDPVLELTRTSINLRQDPLDNANTRLALLDRCIAGLQEDGEMVAKLKKLLESGDIEGAVMVLQTSRAKVLEQQLSTRIEGMSARNAAIRSKNDDMAFKQGELAGLTGDNQKADYANKQKEITKIKGEIDQLNSDSSLDMIGIQTLVNKRNEAFDTLTNLMGKFQKTIDGIVGNMR
jgi:hypothetical protein